ncbi:MarR family winged helix-turn-helix transcriptional regulator [Streptomyces sp. NPDC048442]|uniref:MarR family winged helix-turn-helix transcriptional regulator n=1 Tax=Streptomyces sp. NPDC048442 TaxID=3154823 RepID=UPI00343EAF86
MTKHDPEAGQPRTADELLDAAGPALGKLRRSSLLEVEEPFSRKELGRTLVLNVLLEAEQKTAGQKAAGQEAAEDGDAGPFEVTVGAIGEFLSVDPSVASRMVSDCISAGYVVRAASQQDGRRTVLHLSDEGRAMMARFRRHQRQAFEYVTADWAESDRLQFARLVLRYVEAQDSLRHRDPVRGTQR